MPALPAVVNAAVAAKYDRADLGDADVDNDNDGDRGDAAADDDDRCGADDDYIYLALMQLPPPRILIAPRFFKFYKIVKHGDENGGW